MAKFNSPADAIRGLTESVTKDWTKLRKAEERSANAENARMTRLVRSRRITIREAAFDVMEKAYDLASAGGTLPVNPRQIYYAARRSILLATGADKIPVVDIGLRLADVEELDLLSEPFTTNKKNVDAISRTLKRHGATKAEIELLLHETFYEAIKGERVELNALTSDEFIAFVERKFEEHGVKKIIPDDGVLELHARRMLERRLVLRELDKLLPNIRQQVTDTDLPDNLREQVEALLEEQPALPWDAAVAEIIDDEDKDSEA